MSLLSKTNKQPNSSKPNRAMEDKVTTVNEAIMLVQEYFTNPERLGEERAARNKAAAESAMSGAKDAKEKALKLLREFLVENGVKVQDIVTDVLALEIYKEIWGLGPLEEIYEDRNVNEIQINAPDRIYVMRNLKLERLDGVKFRDNDHVMNFVTRMVMHDRGVSLNRSSPTIESMRKDGTRITATCPPVTEHVTVALRKHLQRVVPFDEMVRRGVMDTRGADILRLLVRGRANVAVIGGVGSGKTTLVRTMCGEIPPNARIIVIETDRELDLARNYPERNIVEMEEHQEIKRTLKELFRTVLRYSPVVIIVGEFRGEGEASEAIQACERGHDGSMTTAHFSSPELFVKGTARMLIREGLALPEKTVEEMVASAFNIVVKMYGDPTRGIMKLESVTELTPGEPFSCRRLYEWEYIEGDYEKGQWRICGKPSAGLLNRLFKHGVAKAEVDEVFGRTC
ncbi:MAG: Flp pilus assembly complex ATPase component TadA [Firmicutes bacterium]|nr:Flp pilus assembly complex ATPase component TadA [Bacillota bacterium]